MNLALSTSSERGWGAELELQFEARDGRSVLARRCHRGPLLVQRPFYPEGDATAHAYVLHPPGGVVGGDELRVRVEAGQGTHALVTTPAAAKLYRSLGKVARCHSTLHVREQAIVEWLPGETLAFDGARVDLRTKVQLAPGGVFVGWEIVGLGRPACNERFAAGKLAQRFEIWRGEEPLWIERGRYAGDAAVLREPWGLGAAPVSGVLAAVPADANILEAARSAVVAGKDWTFSATLLEQTLVARVLSKSAAQARTCLEAVWRALRPAVVGRPACAPRIWKT